ncbi:MAG TPA: hypothetical protein VGM43_12580 [Bryobacteraceae bacterium]
MTAKKAQNLPAAAPVAKMQFRVVTLPRFEDHGDRICEWLSVLNLESPSRRRVNLVIRELREAEAKACRVRNSARHENLALFLGHAAHSLESAEIPGARYILMMAHALLSARATKEGNHAEAGIVLQLRRRTTATAGSPGATEIVAG